MTEARYCPAWPASSRPAMSAWLIPRVAAAASFCAWVAATAGDASTAARTARTTTRPNTTWPNVQPISVSCQGTEQDPYDRPGEGLGRFHEHRARPGAPPARLASRGAGQRGRAHGPAALADRGDARPLGPKGRGDRASRRRRPARQGRGCRLTRAGAAALGARARNRPRARARLDRPPARLPAAP